MRRADAPSMDADDWRRKYVAAYAQSERLRKAWQTQQNLLVKTEAERKQLRDHAEDVVLGLVRELDAVMGRDAVASGYYQHAIDFLKACERDASGSRVF